MYIIESIYNTDPNYDYGAFTRLKTKLTSTGLDITTFSNTFANEGVYVFGDYASPD